MSAALRIIVVAAIGGTACAGRARGDVVKPAAPIAGPVSGARPIILLGGGGGRGSSTDSRAIDANSPSSPYAGVASLFIGGRHLATGAPISPHHIITAAHCFDVDGDGLNDFGTDVAIFFNCEGDLSTVVPSMGVESVTFHPDYAGFSPTNVNDDLAIVTLAEPLPPAAPVYRLWTSEPRGGETVIFIGYGESGDGVRGYAAGTGSFIVKRLGANVLDVAIADDEGGVRDGRTTLEAWEYDFDGPQGDGPLGGPTLGEGVEATLGIGDSGGPGFVLVDGEPVLFSVSTFVCSEPEGRYGAIGGGMLVSAYAEWIQSIIEAGDGAAIASVAPGADRTGDGVVDAADLRAVLEDWGLAPSRFEPSRGDADGDGIVGAGDIASVLRGWTVR